MRRIAIIGGGASGIVASILAKSDFTEVDIYEKSSVLGKKIRVSGNGKCNIFNTDLKTDNFFSGDKEFVKEVFKRFDYEKFRDFFNSLPVLLDVKDDKKVYPLSYSAKSLMQILQSTLKRKEISLFLNTSIKSIEKTDKGFVVYGDDFKKVYDKVLMSTGSKAFVRNDTDIGYKIAENFSHTIKDVLPSLVQLVCKDRILKKIKGVKTKAKVTMILKKDSKRVETYGDVLFTSYGLSGFAIIDISPYASQILNSGERVILSLNLLPDFQKDFIENIFKKAKKKEPDFRVLDILCGMLDINLAKAILIKKMIDFDTTLKSLSVKDIKNIVHAVFDWRFEVTATKGFEYAEVCLGGVDTKEVDVKTMESKKVKDLFFAGEILDVCGKRGGFNLAFAWASGYIAGKSMRETRYGKRGMRDEMRSEFQPI